MSSFKEAIDKGQAAIEGTSCPKTWLMNLAKSSALDDIFKTMPGLASEDRAVRAGFVVDTNLYVVGVGGASVALFGVDFDGEKLRAAAGLSGPVFEGADEAGYEKAICDVLAHPLVARRIRAMLNGVTRIRHDLNGWPV